MDSILVLRVVLRKEISDRKNVPGDRRPCPESERPAIRCASLRVSNVLGCERRALFALLLETVSFLRNLVNLSAKDIQPPGDKRYARGVQNETDTWFSFAGR
jgi:hypothetical protein